MTAERGNRLLAAIDRWAGIPLTIPAAAWRKLTSPRPPETPAKIGIFCPGAVGDLLLLSALTDALRKRFPECELELLATRANAGALPLNPHADSCKSWPLHRPDRILGYIRKRNYDVFIDTSQWSRLGNLLANLSGARITAGFATRGQFRSLGYDYVCRHNASCHETENFLNLGRAIWPGLEGSPGLKMALPEKGDKPEPVVYCHLWPAPGKGRIFKEWPREHWAELIRALLADGYEIRLTGGRDDRRACEEFRLRHFSAECRVSSIAGQADWQALAALFARASAIVSVNTGTMHLAALTGSPTVGLHGATNPARWGPVGKAAISLLPESGDCAYLNLGFEYPRHARPAMRSLKVGAVLAALRKLGVAPRPQSAWPLQARTSAAPFPKAFSQSSGKCSSR